MNMTMNQNFQGGIQMDNIEKARSRLIDYINDTGKSQAVISKRIGLSPATMSQFLNDSYSGDDERRYLHSSRRYKMVSLFNT